jgi:hypothetical protein
VVDASKPKPIDPDEQAKLGKRDIKAQMIISINLRSSLLVHVRDCKTTKELWDKLKCLFESSSMSRRMFLIRKLNTYNMDEGESISYYLDRIKEIHDQLHDACDRISNKEMVPITLNGFSNYYEMFVNIVAGRETVPSFEKLYDIFLSKEMHKKLKNKKDSKDVALWSKTNIFGKKRQKRKGKKKPSTTTQWG